MSYDPPFVNYKRCHDCPLAVRGYDKGAIFFSCPRIAIGEDCIKVTMEPSP